MLSDVGKTYFGTALIHSHTSPLTRQLEQGLDLSHLTFFFLQFSQLTAFLFRFFFGSEWEAEDKRAWTVGGELDDEEEEEETEERCL